jgi:hypothetical protein
MNKKFYKLLIAAIIMLLPNFLLSQRIHEKFGVFQTPGWYVKNNTFPQPAQNVTWSQNPPDPIVGYEVADNWGLGGLVATQRYAYVGYSEADYDGANISQWLISPVIPEIKNGDVIKFKTRAQPGMSAFDGFMNLISFNLAEFISCNRPNRMEVRLSINESNNTPPNVGDSADTYGDFDRILKVINPDLTLTGYSQNWVEHTITISGLPPGQSFKGRIGFWYHFPNGGYNNCKSRRQLPEPVNYFAGAVAGQMPDGGIGYNVALSAWNIISAQFPQVGKNGTYIALDDFIYEPGLYLVESYTRKVYSNGGGNPPFNNFTYAGSKSCSPFQNHTKYFILKNYTNEAITVFPKIAINSYAFKLQSGGVQTIQPGEMVMYTISVKDSMLAGSTGTGVFMLYKNFDGGETLLGVNLSYSITAANPPVAKCVSYNQGNFSVTLNDSGKVTVDARDINDGSTNSCGDTTGLAYSIVNNHWEHGMSSRTFTCNNVGNNNVLLKVKEVGATNGVYSTCPVTITVYANVIPQMDCSQPQTYYLSANQSAMPVNALAAPPVTVSQCPNPTPTAYYYKNWSNANFYPPFSSFGPGTYEVGWTVEGANPAFPGYCTKTLNVIDTIKPVAFCKDTARIGYTFEVPGYGLFIKQNISGKDLDWGSTDNVKVQKLYLSTTWNGNSGNWVPAYDTYGVFGIPFDCSNAGAVFPISLKVEDGSGNSATCNSIAKIALPDQPTCKNISISINPSSQYYLEPTTTITPGQLLSNGMGNGICGITNAAVSKSAFTCADVNKTIPVTVSYKDASNVQHSCVSQVTVNQYSAPAPCPDTVNLYVNAPDLEASATLSPLIDAACSSQLQWTFSSTGATNTFWGTETYTGNKIKSFKPGISHVTRTTTYLGNTYTCSQVFAVYDTHAPIITSTPSNQTIQLPSLGNKCHYDLEIENPFQQGSYSYWKYTFSGATVKTVIISPNDYNYWNNYWLPKWDSINPGVTTVTISAYDHVQNVATVSYTVDLYVQNLATPSVYSEKLQNNPYLIGNYCGENLGIWIPSPVNNVCKHANYMWYYEVRDGYMGNILYELDSIPQDSGAFIPVKIGPYYNQSYPRTIHLGFHDILWGSKQLSSYPSVSVRDTFIAVTCPNDTTVQNNNNTTYLYPYTIQSPIANSCSGSYWGYSISGATVDSTINQSVAYNSNQAIALTQQIVSDAYPSMAYNTSPVVQLKNGVNKIKLRILEESGNLSTYFGPECSYSVTVQDVSIPQMTCPTNDTLHRSSPDTCIVTVGGPCQQVNGFSGPFGESGLMALGGNSRIILDKTTAPGSVKFTSSQTYLSYNDSYIRLTFNCSGTVSFNWEYKSSSPQFFRPFTAFNNYNPQAYNQTPLSGFNQNSTGVQTGTYSQAVNKGDVLVVGLMEGGTGSGYFKLSNFSAPHSDPWVEIDKPGFTSHSSVYFESDIASSYPIGNHTINYGLTNLNNGNTATCTQQLTVIDDFATTLVCSDTTIYINQSGFAVLKAQDVISTCFPISSTTLSKDTFDCSETGAHIVTITSISQSGDTLSCNLNVTVQDTMKPISINGKMTVDLYPPGNTFTLTDSVIGSYFYDNCGIETVSASQTSFGCNDVGMNYITLTATDSSGNSNQATLIVEVYPLGFNLNDPEVTDVVCVGESKMFCSQSGSLDNPLQYQWQKKETDFSKWPWNFYTCGSNFNIINGGGYHQFHRLKINQYHDYTYMIYTDFTRSGISFRQLNPANATWAPTFTYLPVTNGLKATTNSYGTFYLNTFKQDNTPYVVYLDNNGSFKAQRYAGGQWSEISTSIFWTINQDFNDLYRGDEYYFPVKWNGVVYVAKDWNSVSNFSEHWALYTPSSNKFSTYVTNAKNIVGIRNELNQNVFFSLNIHPTSFHITGKDSLTTDPTENSSVFEMEWFNNQAHIAYKSSSGKATVKKYLGSDSWALVGQADFTLGTINKLDMGTIGDTLYLIYSEAGDTIKAKKLVGNDWVDMDPPTKNTNLIGNYGFKMNDINGAPSIYIRNHPSVPEFSKLITNDGWTTVSGGSSCYTPNTSEPSDNEYRCIATKSGCASTVSGTKRLVVKEIPSISVADTTIIGQGSVTLTANSSAGTVYWAEQETGGPILTTGSDYTTPVLVTDAVYYAYSVNGQCASDTVMSTVFVNDTEESFDYYDVIYYDSICPGEWKEVRLDTTVYGHEYALYEKGADGNYTLYGGTNTTNNYWIFPNQTTTYKYYVRSSENLKDAAQFALGGFCQEEHISFGNPQLPLDKELTIEGWVHHTSNQYLGNSFQMMYGSRNYDFYGTNKRFQVGFQGSFMVYNGGNRVRQLPLPAASSPTGWTHVALTADSSGLEVYYDGVLVASSSDTASLPINNVNEEFVFGRYEHDCKADYLSGVDEFRVWDVKRTATEIADNISECLSGFEPNLLLYNNFSQFDSTSNTFLSQKGPDAIFADRNYGHDPLRIRDTSCTNPKVNQIYLPPFTVTVLQGQPIITSTVDYGSSTPGCGGEVINVVAHADNGIVNWYDALEGGNLIATGDTLSVFVDKDTSFYAQAGNSICERWEVTVDVYGYPEILEVTSDPLCSGETLYDANPSANYNNEANGYELFDTPTGGTMLDLYGSDGNRVMTENDTLWVEAYNNYCVATERVPVIINIREVPLVTSTKDSSNCGEGTVTLEATGVGGVIEWWNEDDTQLLHTGDTFITPVLSETTNYYAWVYSDYCSWSNQGVLVSATIINSIKNDTVIACDSYTWADGNTYSASGTYNDTTLNAGGCDSIFNLHLTVVSIEDRYVSVAGYGVCTGDSTTITIYSSQIGYDYTLRDTSDNSVVAGPVTGSGADIVFSTGALAQTTGYIITVDKTASNSTDTVTCSDQIGDIITINAGEARSIAEVETCNSYFWQGNTYLASGTYYDTLTAAAGCDSILELRLNLFPSSSYTENISACDSFTWHGVTYTSSTNTPTWTGINPFGCDSVVTLNLTIFSPGNTDTTVTACNSFSWHGTNYTSSGTYVDTIFTQGGCVVTNTLLLTINSGIATGTDVISACNSYTWIDGNTYNASNSTATHNIVGGAASGCDSVVTLNLTINNSAAGADVISACNSYTWIDGNTYNASNSTATHTIAGGAANGCDSVVTLNLSINNSATGTDVISACNSYTWIDGNTYNASNSTATHTIAGGAANGCDSLVTLNLTISSGSDTTFTVTAFNSYTWQGNTLTTSGVYTDTLSCGAVHTLDLTLTFNISGTITYDNSAATEMNNVKVYLYQNSLAVDSAVTGANGDYLFAPRANGSYTLIASTVKEWGGVNSTDALLVQNHFAGNITLAEPRLTAADVNASSSVNTTDALLIKNRFVGTITSFNAGDWHFNPQPVAVSDGNVTMNFKGICFGDVNGSFSPSTAKVGSIVSLSESGTINLTSGSPVQIPVSAANAMQVGAMSLVLSYPQNKVEVLSVSAVAPGLSNVFSNIANGQVRIAWSSLQTLSINTDDILFTVTVQALPEATGEVNFEVGGESEFADASGNIIAATLNIPVMNLGTTNIVSASTAAFGVSIYPNPSAETATIIYTLPEAGSVTISLYDITGRIIDNLLSQNQVAGIHSLTLNSAVLADGIYYCFFNLDNGTNIISERKTIAVVR